MRYTFAAKTAPPEHRYKAFALFQETAGGGRNLLTRWKTLPEGISFRDAPETLMRAPRSMFAFNGDTQWACPYLRFDARGRIASPVDARLLRLVVFEGFTESPGVETVTADQPDAALGAITFSRSTGRARYEEGS